MSLIGRWLVLIRLSEMMNGLRLIWNSVFGFQCTCVLYIEIVIFLDSSVVEHAAVNRGVVGSSPTRGGCPQRAVGDARDMNRSQTARSGHREFASQILPEIVKRLRLADKP